MQPIINWELFLDDWFSRFLPLVEKREYRNGLTISFKKEEIYVWCDLSMDRMIIKKLEFGRLVTDEQGGEQANWVKGVFINDGQRYTTFLQTSYDSEYFDKKNNYTIQFDKRNTSIIERFLNAPCVTGWVEYEYHIGHRDSYKVIVALNDVKWTIKLLSVGEQDIPFATDILEIWVSVQLADAFWNNARRTVKEIIVRGMNDRQ